jgi:ABC-type lipoprotein release transport system permease subunit
VYRPFLAVRFIRTRVIVWLGILSIAATVAVFVVVMGVLEGFSEQLRDMVRRTTSHVDVSRPYVGGLADWQTVAQIASRHPEVVGTTPYVQGPALMQSQRYRFYGFLKGVDWEREKLYGHVTGYVRIPLSLEEIAKRSGLDNAAAEKALSRLIKKRIAIETFDHAGRTLYQRIIEKPSLGGSEERAVFDALKTLPDKIEPLDPDTPPGIPAIIVGDRIWTEMDLKRGELLRVSVQAGDEGDMARQVFVVIGEFKTGSQLFDHWALTNLSDAQTLFAMSSNVHGVGVWIRNYARSMTVRDDLKAIFEDPSIIGLGGVKGFERSPRVAQLIGKDPLPVIRDPFPGDYRIRSWIDQQEDLFQAIAIENKMMRLIFVLFFLLIGVFVLSILYVMVTEKVRDIGILMAVGARVSGVMQLFLSVGLFVGLVGCALGLSSGLLLALNVNEVTQALHLDIFPQEIFKVERIPVTILPFDLMLVSLVALGTSVLASVYPALRAAHMNPVESLRHE